MSLFGVMLLNRLVSGVIDELELGSVGVWVLW